MESNPYCHTYSASPTLLLVHVSFAGWHVGVPCLSYISSLYSLKRVDYPYHFAIPASFGVRPDPAFWRVAGQCPCQVFCLCCCATLEMPSRISAFLLSSNSLRSHLTMVISEIPMASATSHCRTFAIRISSLRSLLHIFFTSILTPLPAMLYNDYGIIIIHNIYNVKAPGRVQRYEENDNSNP